MWALRSKWQSKQNKPNKKFLPFVISTLWRDPLSNSNKRFLDYAIATLEMTNHVSTTLEMKKEMFGASNETRDAELNSAWHKA